MRKTSTLVFAAVALLGLAGAVASCGSNGSTSTSSGGCTPGAQTSCACVGGSQGVQVCNADGKSLGACQCSSASGAGGATASTSGTGALNGTGGSSCQCTDPAPSEGKAPYCGAAACAAMSSSSSASTSTTTTSTSSSTSSSGCVGQATFAGVAPTTFGSLWSYKAMSGIQAGDQLCMDMGADHVCDYDDLVYAAAQGELAAVPTGTKAWLERTHAVTVTATSPKINIPAGAAVVGTSYGVGPASRCDNWTYSTDHCNDGEWVDFSGSTPTFHFDDDPCNIQTGTKDSPCGQNHLPRSVLCCFPKNSCNPPVAPATAACAPPSGVCAGI